MNYTQQRTKLRAVLAGSKCLSPACVYDPISARVAESVGYEIAVLPGSDASTTTLAAPDLDGSAIVLTLTEFAEQIRRIMRVSNLSLFADADNGYGNAFNVMRTVQEFEHSGIAGLSIEDTVLPTPFGLGNNKAAMISTEEAVSKLRSALEARSDPSLVIAARTNALKAEGLEAAIARAKAYAATGVDTVIIVGLKTLNELDAIHAAIDLPIMLGAVPESMKRDDLAARGARILSRGHHTPLPAVIKTLHDIYKHLYADAPPSALRGQIATDEEIDRIRHDDTYRKWEQKYLR